MSRLKNFTLAALTAASAALLPIKDVYAQTRTATGRVNPVACDAILTAEQLNARKNTVHEQVQIVNQDRRKGLERAIAVVPSADYLQLTANHGGVFFASDLATRELVAYDSIRGNLIDLAKWRKAGNKPDTLRGELRIGFEPGRTGYELSNVTNIPASDCDRQPVKIALIRGQDPNARLNAETRARVAGDSALAEQDKYLGTQIATTNTRIDSTNAALRTMQSEEARRRRQFTADSTADAKRKADELARQRSAYERQQFVQDSIRRVNARRTTTTTSSGDIGLGLNYGPHHTDFNPLDNGSIPGRSDGQIGGIVATLASAPSKNVIFYVNGHAGVTSGTFEGLTVNPRTGIRPDFDLSGIDYGIDGRVQAQIKGVIGAGVGGSFRKVSTDMTPVEGGPTMNGEQNRTSYEGFLVAGPQVANLAAGVRRNNNGESATPGHKEVDTKFVRLTVDGKTVGMFPLRAEAELYRQDGVNGEPNFDRTGLRVRGEFQVTQGPNWGFALFGDHTSEKDHFGQVATRSETTGGAKVTYRWK